MQTKKYLINSELSGMRLDKALTAKEKELSRATIQRLIEEEKILVNGKKSKVSYKVSENDEITLFEDEPKPITLEAEDIPLDIIYEDDDILVISKPSGLVVHEASSLKGESTLVDFLKQSNRQLATLGGEFRAGIVHRLDRYTSGVMVVAKSDFASAELSSQLQQKTASRIYIALCDLPRKQNCVVERAIG